MDQQLHLIVKHFQHCIKKYFTDRNFWIIFLKKLGAFIDLFQFNLMELHNCSSCIDREEKICFLVFKFTNILSNISISIQNSKFVAPLSINSDLCLEETMFKRRSKTLLRKILFNETTNYQVLKSSQVIQRRINSR